MYLAIIPARGGSRGLARKNIIDLAGKPLIAYSIEAAHAANLDKVIVSSECDDILQISEELGATPLKRPHELAQDTTPTASVIRHVIESCSFDESLTIVLLQPTSPLRKAMHILEALEQFKKYDCDGLISVFKMRKTPFKAYVKDDEGRLKGLISPDTPYMPRQLLPEAFYPNGAIYIFEWLVFLNYSGIPNRNLSGYCMSEEESVDIDTIADLYEAERVLRIQHEY